MQTSTISGMGYTSSAADSLAVWTPLQLTQLQTYVEQRMSVNEIAQKLNRSVSAVRIQATALGLNLNSK
jgi:hypothetical protein